MKRAILGCVLFTLGWTLTACHTPSVGTPTSAPLDNQWCGDGIRSGPESPERRPQDCRPQTRSRPQDAAQSNPLLVFYAVHTHLVGDHLPYDDDNLTSIDPIVAENIRLTIEGLAAVLDRYDAKATWELVYGMASGLCSFPTTQDLLSSLMSKGHEIGTHSHNSDEIIRAYRALADRCGIEANVTSGFLIDATQPFADPHQVITQDIQIALDLEIHVTTENLSLGSGRDPFGDSCTEIGEANDMADLTGNMLYPWKPDYVHSNICNHNPEGEMIFLDHVSIEWVILDDQSGAPDVLESRHFAQLQAYFDAALAYHEAHSDQGVAVWGFVTHITEYMPGGDGQSPPDSTSLAALEAFMTYLAEFAAQGRIEFVTASQAAELAFPDP